MRLSDWHDRLARLFAQRLQAPFEWGSHDCVMFAADAVAAVTGRDPAAGIRGTYRCALGAARVLRAHDGLPGVATASLGEPIAPLFARIGDIGWLPGEAARGSLAVCNGTFWLAPALRGLAVLPLDAAATAWRVD